MERQTIILGVSLAVLLSLAGFYGAFLYEGDGSDTNQEFPISLNVTVNSENEISTAEFDNRSMNLMLESRPSARFYFDFDRDGSFDRELDFQSDGIQRNTTELIKLGNNSYKLYLRYRDDSDTDDDAFMTLFRVEKP